MKTPQFANTGTTSATTQQRITAVDEHREQCAQRGAEAAKGIAKAAVQGVPASCNVVSLQFTGCVSELSCLNQSNPKYSKALRNYGEVYRQYHSDLLAHDPAAEHDYTLAVAATEEHSHLGFLGDDIEQALHAGNHFSDEEIEKFAYLGWLQL